jgi:N-hydroxyarylamine O-acetyltransferase
MGLTGRQVTTLLRRIGAERPANTSAPQLARLHSAFSRAVPSEDYDIHSGVPLSLAVPDLFEKIARRGRGGFCYELNGLFAALLRELSFGVTLLSAFSLAEDGTRGPDFDHLRLLVETDDGDSWLADVGDGGRWNAPVPARGGEYGDIRVHRDRDLWWTAHRHSDGSWQRSWGWLEVPRKLSDFATRCRYHELDPDSYFRAHRFAVLPTPTGRLSLNNGVYSEIVAGVRTDRAVDAAEERALLAKRFGIVLDRWWQQLPS